jgi:hypothetical protein
MGGPRCCAGRMSRLDGRRLRGWSSGQGFAARAGEWEGHEAGETCLFLTTLAGCCVNVSSWVLWEI